MTEVVHHFGMTAHHSGSASISDPFPVFMFMHLFKKIVCILCDA